MCNVMYDVCDVLKTLCKESIRSINVSVSISRGVKSFYTAGSISTSRIWKLSLRDFLINFLIAQLIQQAQFPHLAQFPHHSRLNFHIPNIKKHDTFSVVL